MFGELLDISNWLSSRACKTWNMPIGFLCGLCLPDLKIIQAGEILCIFFAVIFTAKSAKNYARLNGSSGQAKRRKAVLKGYV
jgi:hypothetical protein